MSRKLLDTRLVIVGCGGVGLALIRHIIRLRDSNTCHIPVRAVCDSKHVATASGAEELDTELLKKLMSAKAAGAGLDSVAGVLAKPVGQGLDDILAEMGKSPVRYIYADCTASFSMGETLVRVLEAGGSIALANKKPITGPTLLFQQLSADPRRIRCESTCGAGMPLVTAVQRIVRSGDPVSKMAGALSGTLGFVMSGLEEGQRFSSVVAAAKEAGFTEPDPRDDLSGLDVARKALILARLLGYQLELPDVTVESLYPGGLAPEVMSVEEFMSAGLPQLDAEFQAKVAAAAEKGEVLRYAAVVESGRCSVGLQSVPKESPLGQLSGTDNLLEIRSECYHPNPLVLQGRGAGTDATASGVLADILELVDCAPRPSRHELVAADCV
mmetsp:Transcript_39924/g.55501  ORF Transcript_39924/g.55501 Transcript_39924/m.55501 type:complete len:384 (-) Transcript_39924:40-1191(-)|eukprot:CAMPEP_0196593434 /NCGR_PEP_ID=MMETSP1081-20130531/75605_1 /TAXON_ID=36882 /ORGANISM="Pyramimonas amylifera, Strain CCMP720" /LENGTH=383 /DNA_ID=CAMNT_0041917419 /DNA_START=28 /DNA_END=1179 /DNA_ORIENTATION=-